MQLARQVLLDPCELLGRHDVGHVELAGPVLAELGAGLGVVQVAHVRDARGGVVPVVRVSRGDHVRAHHPVLEHERAVRHELAGPRVLRAVLRQRRAVHGEGARMREDAEQVRRRVRELDHDGAVVRRGHANRVRRLLAGHDGRGVQHGLEDLCVRRGRGRIDEPAHAGDEIGRPHGIAVRPAQPVAQPERVLEAVRAHRPRLGRRRHHCAVRTDGGQAFEQVTLDVERCVGAAALRVERVGLGPVAPAQRRGVGRDHGLGRVGRRRCRLATTAGDEQRSQAGHHHRIQACRHRARQSGHGINVLVQRVPGCPPRPRVASGERAATTPPPA